ncbi:MAG: rhomboid family intramembrane serine protease [Bacteroidetes bacterium]|uniref:Rhomboid family intramembrane serine protease n=1 Tax=Candidatus Pullibacteroides excrementavium TaxID=2840905 RepID=A0A9D9DVR0_9BACT|nr:rhomboid family intramembrane serine protease [Candidatus Pullibacteroides excrementavium]
MAQSDNYTLRGFSFLPPVVKNLLILNVLFFLADISLQTRGIDLTQWLGLHYITAQDFYPWQFITYMFMHGNFSHLFFNMFALWMFGYALENYWGSKRFLVYYLITGVGAALIQTGVLALEIRGMTQGLPPFAAQHYINQIVTVGASGAVYGILLAFGMCFPNVPIFLYFFFPIKAKWFVIIYGVIELFAGIGGTADGVAHFAHLGGMIFGLLLILYWRKHGSRIR